MSIPPAPWTWETESGEWPDHALIDGNGESILWWDFDLGFRFACDGDARLIAKAPDMHAALRLALPVMRRTAAEYLDSVMVRSDPATISRTDWEEIAPDLEAIVAAEACIGREEHDCPWLDAIIDSSVWKGSKTTG